MRLIKTTYAFYDGSEQIEVEIHMINIRKVICRYANQPKSGEQEYFYDHDEPLTESIALDYAKKFKANPYK